MEMKRKEVDDVLGGSEAWANVDKTDGTQLFPSHYMISFFDLGEEDHY